MRELHVLLRQIHVKSQSGKTISSLIHASKDPTVFIMAALHHGGPRAITGRQISKTTHDKNHLRAKKVHITKKK